MLATDLHSPKVKTKMTKAEFMKNMRGINDGGNLPENMLSDIFDRIAANRLADTNTDLAGEDPKSKDLFSKEVKQIVKKSQELIKESINTKSTFVKSSHIKHVAPMFEVAWCPIFAVLSMFLEESEDPQVFELALAGFKYAIRISCLFFMETERNAFISSLASFTFLNNVREIKQKNIECIKTLIGCALVNGNYLQKSWTHVLKCISQLERLHLVAAGAKTEVQEPLPTQEDKTASDGFRMFFMSTKKDTRASIRAQIEEINSTTIAEQIDVTAIDKIFTGSTKLNSVAIVEFVNCLCAVSMEEMDMNQPRTFSVQKLVEIAYYNMNRIRLVWSKIWGILAQHFTLVACNPNKTLAMYAIDSLRQLAMKFLEKDELTNYNFQKDFLKPFENIMLTQTSTPQIRELIIHCLSQMIYSRAGNIKSGWKSIFTVFSFSSNESDVHLVSLAFSSVEMVIRKHFPLISESFFVECVNCLIAFANNSASKDISMKAIDLIEYCAKQLVEGKVCALEAGGLFVDRDNHLKLWFPIFTGLTRTISHPNMEVRTLAQIRLFSVLKSHGSLFNPGMWELIFRGVLLPIFENVGYIQTNQQDDWLDTTCCPALHSLVDLFSQFFTIVSFLLKDLLNLLATCILQDNERLSRMGVMCLFELIESNCMKMSGDMWITFCVALNRITRENFPREIISLVGSKCQDSIRAVMDLSKNNTTDNIFGKDEGDTKSEVDAVGPENSTDENEDKNGNEEEKREKGKAEEDSGVVRMEEAVREDLLGSVNNTEKNVLSSLSSPVISSTTSSSSSSSSSSPSHHTTPSFSSSGSKRLSGNDNPFPRPFSPSASSPVLPTSVNASSTRIVQLSSSACTPPHRHIGRNQLVSSSGHKLNNVADKSINAIALRSSDWKIVRGKVNVQLLLIRGICAICIKCGYHLNPTEVQVQIPADTPDKGEGELLSSKSQIESTMTLNHLLRLVDVMFVAYRLVALVNTDIEFLKVIAGSGLCKVLMKEEVEAETNYLKIMFWLCKNISLDQKLTLSQSVVKFCHQELSEFISVEQKLLSLKKSSLPLANEPENHTNLDQVVLHDHHQSKVQIMVLLLKELYEMREDVFLLHIFKIFGLLCDLVESESADIRSALRLVLRRHAQLAKLI
eukprot:TRINITY_DN4101_c0_g1_i2.p1 TRINITY_DN4101_c0_g1~~TRINITY_DN4101_c0_g1_i2.p1  ORF type:complete len:1325 (+),score=338.62 TRINITY_DN4101_c0_g1_i2:566-3976(+)